MEAQKLSGSRFNRLKKHLKKENPLLEDILGVFQKLDRLGRGLGYLEKEASFALRTSWWPLISVLGTYSSGKSSFLNYYLGIDLQPTGSQAVDDKFTVICYSPEKNVQTLPGQALDSDPRFPLYNISRNIEAEAPGENLSVDRFLHLKTCNSPKLKGRILVDSPGFDADAQRDATLRITDRIMDLSDLVLVFFDARHPESGSMRDTLKHLVQHTVQRNDAEKFMYILNQVDVTAREDNAEDVFAAWQRSLAQHGLISGRYFSIYNPEAAGPFEDEALGQRYDKKCRHDLSMIFERIDQVKIDRVYRVVGLLEKSAKMFELDLLPLLKAFLRRWRRQVLLAEGTIFLFLAALAWILAGRFSEFSITAVLHAAPEKLAGSPVWQLLGLAGILLAGWGHFVLRGRLGRRLMAKTLANIDDQRFREGCARALYKNIRWWRSLWRSRPAGWSRKKERTVQDILRSVDGFIQTLNDIYTDPSGKNERPEPLESETAKQEENV